MAKTWLFYDVESSDLNKVFGQVMQFAAVRTDEAFNELETHSFYVKLNRDVLPNPDAVMVHGISPYVANTGYSEPEAMEIIHQLVNEPGTWNGGYNTLGYDDEVLRFGFYRNFLSPYTHGFSQQCRRFDLFPMVMFFYVDGYEGLEWPIIDGKVSFKLEHLNAANQWVEGAAHDALVDVRVCVALAKNLAQDQKRFNRALNLLAAKDAPSDDRATYLSARLGHQQQFMAPVKWLGAHQTMGNTGFWLNLNRVDFAQDGLDQSAVMRKKKMDTALILPERPALFEVPRVIDNLAWLEDHPDALESLKETICSATFDEIEDIDIDAGLYQHGFFTDQENVLMANLSALPRTKWLASFSQSHRLYQMMLKWLWRHAWDVLAPVDLAQALRLVLNPGKDYQGMRRVDYATQLQRINELHTMLEDDPRRMALLKDLSQYYQNHLSLF
jgi:exodeoxyribonuclease-1